MKEHAVYFNAYSLLRAQRIELGRDLRFFSKYYFKDHNSIPSPEFHDDTMLVLMDMTKNRGSKFAIAAPRDSAKSTIITLKYVIQAICYRLEPYIIIIANTSDQACNYLANIKRELTSNPRLIEDFPHICEIGKKPGPPRWKNDEIITKNDIRVTALSMGQQIRGRRHGKYRPTLIILDDIETSDDSKSAETFDKMYEWLTKSIFRSISENSNIIIAGTIHNYRSILAEFTHSSQHPGWIKRIYRSVISWATHIDLWEEWGQIFNNRVSYNGLTGPVGAKEFYKVNEALMLEGSKVLWPQKYSYYDLMAMREQDGYYSFDSEMQNEPVNPRDCLFNVNDVHFWDDAFTEEDLIRHLGTNKEIYGACDPSLGKDTTKGDYSAIITAFRDYKTNTIYIVDSDLKRRLPDETIDTIIEYHKRRKYGLFGFESNAFQELMADELEKRAWEQIGGIPIEKVKHNSDKIARIQSLQPLIKSGKIKFSRRQTALLEEMKYFPKGNHDDGLDALETVVKLCIDNGENGPKVWGI